MRALSLSHILVNLMSIMVSTYSSYRFFISLLLPFVPSAGWLLAMMPSGRLAATSAKPRRRSDHQDMQQQQIIRTCRNSLGRVHGHRPPLPPSLPPTSPHKSSATCHVVMLWMTSLQPFARWLHVLSVQNNSPSHPTPPHLSTTVSAPTSRSTRISYPQG